MNETTMTTEEIHDAFRDSHKSLYDYFTEVHASEREDDDQFYINVNGVDYPYFLTMSDKVPDDMCCRTIIDGESYYFG